MRVLILLLSFACLNTNLLSNSETFVGFHRLGIHIWKLNIGLYNEDRNGINIALVNSNRSKEKKGFSLYIGLINIADIRCSGRKKSQGVQIGLVNIDHFGQGSGMRGRPMIKPRKMRLFPFINPSIKCMVRGI